MNTTILHPEVQRYLREQAAVDPAQIALQKSRFAGILPAELAAQVESRQRCRKKLPRWYHTPNIYYPPRIAIEQASSEAAAVYKSRLVSPGSRMIDLTGGFGVDAYYVAQQADTVVYCEQHVPLAEIVQYNLTALGVDNITVKAVDGIRYLHTEPDDAFDGIYVDPSRRKNKRKVFLLDDCEPDVIALQGLLLQKAKNVWIKAAPLLDISSALQALRHVAAVHVISVDNECKEVLFVLERGFQGAPQLTAAAFTGDRWRHFQFTTEEEKSAASIFSLPRRYLYEPDAALLKSGAFRCVGERFGLHKLHTHTHLYTAEQLNPDFIGRIFRVDEVVPYSDFKKRKQEIQANISTRNFPLDTAALHKRHSFKDGGNTFLFFCTGPDKELLVIFTSKC